MGWFDRFSRSGSFSLSPDEIAALNDTTSLDEVAALCLQRLNRELEPLACYAYAWVNLDQQYRLVATLATVSPASADPEPNYSGLMANAPTGAPAPLTLQAADAPPAPEVITLGKERWLAVPIGGLLLLKARFDRHRTISSAMLDRMRDLAQLLTAVVHATQRAEMAREEVDRLQASLKASHLAHRAMLQPEHSLDVLFRLPLGTLDTHHGCLVTCGPNGEETTIKAGVGKGKEMGAHILRGDVPALLEIPPQPDLVRGEPVAPLRSQGFDAVVRVPAIHDGQMRGCAYYFLSGVEQLSTYQLTILTTVSDRFSQVLLNTHRVIEMSDQYVATLHALIATMDLLSPQTVGHSDRMARYARITAREMGLSAEQVEAVALAAYLHDVGMVGLDIELLNSANQLTSEQYEQVKAHTAVGAELVTAVQAVLPIGPAVAHHHERWDGHGYPHRLRGREIPLGARIIAACDLFETKTTSRMNRQALPFSRAIADVQAAAGTQLDPEVVNALVRAFRRLGAEAAADKPTARCWVVRQVPAEVCGSCPNRAHTTAAACWDDPAHLCSRHGDECSRCMVYTEVLARSSGGAHDGERPLT